MKFYRFKKEFAAYGASRTGDENFDPSFVMIFFDDVVPSYDYARPINDPRLWAYECEVDEVTDKKEIASIEKELNQDVEILLKKTNPKRGLGSFAMKGQGGAFYASHRIACHAGFNGKGKVAACTWNLFLLKEEQKPLIRELVEWLVNDSPWLHCIASRWDILSAQERTDRAMEGPVPVNMDAPANEVVGFAVAMRTITEHPWVIQTYVELRKLGASKAVAFMLTGYVQFDNGKWLPYYNTNWHHYLDERMNVKDVCKFFKGGYFLERRSLHKFSERRYDRIAEQVTYLEEEGEMTFRSIRGKHTETTGRGFDRQATVDVPSLIREVNQIWSEA